MLEAIFAVRSDTSLSSSGGCGVQLPKHCGMASQVIALVLGQEQSFPQTVGNCTR